MNTRKKSMLAALAAVPLAVGLTGCGADQSNELVYDCVVQEPSGDYTVVDAAECDNDGSGYAGAHGGVYPFFFYHGGGTVYDTGSTISKSSMTTSQIARANDAAAKSSALTTTSKATGLKVGSNGISSGSKGGFGFSGKSGGGGG